MADEKDTAVDAETTEAVATEVVAEVAAEKPAKAEKARLRRSHTCESCQGFRSATAPRSRPSL
jgi:hypothetical protein